ncbi:MAG: type IV pilus assembly protein PilM [Planctomycetota bacterium]|nr:type IV pilus assembly protein PilM [Planctomycetota bacterium]
MAQGKAAWGIEVGAYEIKAIRLQDGGATGVEVTDFAVIRHKKVLTEPDIDQNEVIRLSLGQLISQKELEGENLVMSVPGHSAFARFAKLPPVEPKKVPDIVKFEAVQQIPFPIEEVEWDYETFMSDGSPEIEVGIFAITRERVEERLDMYSEVGLSPEMLTLSPVAFFNAVSYDHELDKQDEPVVYIDIGTMATDVIIADQGRCWIRTFPIGGTHFTEAIADHFKLSYAKAEKLKMETSTSKYARNIMGAMRPVFANLLQELQRSLDYFRSSHPNRELGNMIGAGSTFKIPGLRKFIGQQLQVDVNRLDEFRRISVPGREAATFAEHNVSMATAYGLAMQGIHLSPIDINLVPTTVLREQLWHRKTRWFIAAAVLAIIAGGITFIRPILDQQALDANPDPASVLRVKGTSKKNNTDLGNAISDMSLSTDANHLAALFDYRSVWPYVVNDAAMATLAAEPKSKEMDPNEIVVREILPEERRLVSISQLSGEYLGPAAGGPRIEVTMNLRLTHEDPVAFVHGTVAKWLRDNNGKRDGIPYIIQDVVLHGTEIKRETIQEDGQSETGKGGQASSDGGSDRRTPGGGGGNNRRSPAGGSNDDNVGRNSPGGGSGAGKRSPGGGGGAGKRSPGGGSGSRSPGGGGSGSRSPGGGGAGLGAPGLGTPGLGTPGASSGGQSNSGSGGSGSSQGHQGQSGQNEGLKGDLNVIAPLPSRPQIYPAGTTIYILPITFTLQIQEETDETSVSSGVDRSQGGRPS